MSKSISRSSDGRDSTDNHSYGIVDTHKVKAYVEANDDSRRPSSRWLESFANIDVS